MADYTVTIGTEQFNSGGSLTIPMPAGTLTGKLLLIYSAVQLFDGGALTTPPSGYTELASTQPGANKSAYLWGKIGTASESSKSVVWGSGQATGWAIAVESTTGWPAIGSVLAGFTSGNTTSPTASIQYGARTVSADGNFAIQMGKRPSPGSPTAVAVTGTWASAGDFLNSTIAAAAQWKKTSGNISANAVALTGGSGTNATGWITAEFVPSASGPAVTATDGTVQIGEAGLTHAPVAAGTEVFTATGLTGNIVKAWII